MAFLLKNRKNAQPSLYEVATSEEPQKNIAIPFNELFGERICFLQASVEKIVPENHSVHIRDQDILYDYLIICAMICFFL